MSMGVATASSNAHCANLKPDAACDEWARRGECDNNPRFMREFCKRSCGLCNANFAADDTQQVNVDASGHQQLPPSRNVFAVPAGQIHVIFRRALEEFDDLEPTLLANTTFPVLQFDKFLQTDDEMTALLQLGEDAGFVDSQMQGDTSMQQWRTSASAMCALPAESAADSLVLADIFDRASKVTRVPLANFERTQVVRYEPGQYYKLHLDQFDELNAQPGGPRVFTLLIFLNDVDDKAGGETVFKYAGDGGGFLIVRPRQGRALLWPNTLDADPMARELKAMHAGGPLKQGVKFAINQWIRQRPVTS